jgi:hypothetical protein
MMRYAMVAMMMASVMMTKTVLAEEAYPAKEMRAASPGKTTYYVNPVSGSDSNSGLRKNKPWKSFTHLNRLNLAAGDRVEILAPGSFDQTLMITGSGTKEAPITIRYAPGRYDIFPENILRRQYHISNTNDDAHGQKALGILFDGAKHVRVTGPGARLVFRAKMIMVCVDGSEDIGISDLSFDYHRPTVSELRVVDKVGDDEVIVEIHKDSAYRLDENGRLTWVGEGWGKHSGLAQLLRPDIDHVFRLPRDPLAGKTFVELEPFRLRTSSGHLGVGNVIQIRDGRRDCVGVFMQHSKDIVWRNVNLYFLHGMGVIGQFTENITFDTVWIAPDPESGRTVAAWADMLHFSGCRGKIVVRNVTFSGANDDAINVHGTHLRVIERVSDKQVKVRFMHRQTFGFQPFFPGDEVDFVRPNLETYAANVVDTVEKLNDREFLLTLRNPVPNDFEEASAVENVTWTPEVHVSGCLVMRIPTRGFLFTTRRPIVVENNVFRRTNMSAILVENDAGGWYESGPVRDLMIRNNLFYHTGGRDPAIFINPHNRGDNPAVHENIRIQDNRFVLHSSIIVRARSTRGVTVTGNRFYSNHRVPEERIVHSMAGTSEVTVENNVVLPIGDFKEE